VFAPAAALIYGVSRPALAGHQLSLLTITCFAIGAFLHMLGRLALGRLRE
jgi:hypothetical protein